MSKDGHIILGATRLLPADDWHTLALWKCALVIILVRWIYLNFLKRFPNLSHIPAVVSVKTPFAPVTYLVNSVLSIKRTYPLVEFGYYKHDIFRVATLHDGWAVIVSGRDALEDMKRAPEDTLSFVQFVDELLQISSVIGRDLVEVPYHMPIIKSQVTRSVGFLFSEIREETAAAFEECLELQEYDWKAIHAQTMVYRVVAHAANRLYVGLPTCRNQEYIDHVIDFVQTTVLSTQFLRFLPEFLKPLVLRLFTNIFQNKQVLAKHLRPIIIARQTLMAEHGVEYPEKPHDILSFLLDHAEGEQQSVNNLTRRIMVLNLVAVLTTSMTFLQALYNIAAYADVTQPLREELEKVVGREGWTKIAMSKLTKMDSFLKETMRTSSLAYDMGRKVLKPFTFSNGITIPAGAHLFVASAATHSDPSNYGGSPSSANRFEPFRFVNDPKSRLVTTTPEYLTFGHGAHACPGRFFAANEMKLMLAHVLMNYDVKLSEKSEGRPENLYFGHACVPNPKAKLLFRRRADPEGLKLKANLI